MKLEDFNLTAEDQETVEEWLASTGCYDPVMLITAPSGDSSLEVFLEYLEKGDDSAVNEMESDCSQSAESTREADEDLPEMAWLDSAFEEYFGDVKYADQKDNEDGLTAVDLTDFLSGEEDEIDWARVVRHAFNTAETSRVVFVLRTRDWQKAANIAWHIENDTGFRVKPVFLLSPFTDQLYEEFCALFDNIEHDADDREQHEKCEEHEEPSISDEDLIDLVCVEQIACEIGLLLKKIENAISDANRVKVLCRAVDISPEEASDEFLRSVCNVLLHTLQFEEKAIFKLADAYGQELYARLTDGSVHPRLDAFRIECVYGERPFTEVGSKIYFYCTHSVIKNLGEGKGAAADEALSAINVMSKVVVDAIHEAKSGGEDSEQNLKLAMAYADVINSILLVANASYSDKVRTFCGHLRLEARYHFNEPDFRRDLEDLEVPDCFESKFMTTVFMLPGVIGKRA